MPSLAPRCPYAFQECTLNTSINMAACPMLVVSEADWKRKAMEMSGCQFKGKKLKKVDYQQIWVTR